MVRTERMVRRMAREAKVRTAKMARRTARIKRPKSLFRMMKKRKRRRRRRKKRRKPKMRRKNHLMKRSQAILSQESVRKFSPKRRKKLGKPSSKSTQEPDSQSTKMEMVKKLPKLLRKPLRLKKRRRPKRKKRKRRPLFNLISMESTHTANMKELSAQHLKFMTRIRTLAFGMKSIGVLMAHRDIWVEKH